MAQGTVVTYAAGREGYLRTHEGITRTALARELAGLKGYAFGGEYVRGQHYPAPRYFVSRDSLCAENAAELGIREPEDLFGGVVPLGFTRTKVITHGLLGEESDRPPGWSRAFSQAVADDVLPGFTVFNRRDAELAGLRLLEGGRARRVPGVPTPPGAADGECILHRGLRRGGPAAPRGLRGLPGYGPRNRALAQVHGDP
ncbi:MAG TPA: DUF3182 family protein [Archangium sp.]|nr:DUF3182 family protein [Archangium sp.]